jgi:hypothetical protein
MKRVAMLLAVAATLAFTACGGDPAAAPTPTPQAGVAGSGGLLAPVDRARTTVDQLNQQTNQMEQQTGGDGSTVP